MEILTYIAVGLVAGWLASVVINGYGMGLLGDIITGIIGSLTGGYIFSFTSISFYGRWGAILKATIGAVAFLVAVRLFARTNMILINMLSSKENSIKSKIFRLKEGNNEKEGKIKKDQQKQC